MSTCPECGSEFEQPKTGRPKTYCSNTCSASVRKKKQRASDKAARELAEQPGTKTEKSIAKVRSDPELSRVANAIVLERWDLIEAVCFALAGGPVPSHLQGQTRREYMVLDKHGTRKPTWRQITPLFALADDCVAELVAEYKNPLRITGKAIADRVKARFIDVQRGDDAFARKEGADRFEADPRRATKLKEVRPRRSFGTDPSILDDPRGGQEDVGGKEHYDDRTAEASDGESSTSRAALAKANTVGLSWSDPVGDKAAGKAEKARKRAASERERLAQKERRQEERIDELLNPIEAWLYRTAHALRRTPRAMLGGVAPLQGVIAVATKQAVEDGQEPITQAEAVEWLTSAFEKMGELVEEGSPTA
jgi:uncharacterized Zn finger protein (UPF0148 family)